MVIKLSNPEEIQTYYDNYHAALTVKVFLGDQQITLGEKE